VRARVTALAIAVLTAAGMLAAFTPGPAQAAANFGAFQAYANGTKQHVRVVDAGGTTLANVDTSFSGAVANSQGLTSPVLNVYNEPVQPAQSGKNSYARGAAAEVGLGSTFPANTDPSQIILPSLLEAAAPPSTDLLTKTLVPIAANPLLNLGVATDKAQALWNSDFCPLGQPISYGANNLAHADLLNAGATPFPGGNPLVSTTPSSDNTDANFNESFTYLFPNGDGTFGIGSDTRQVLAPLAIGRGLAPGGKDLADITILGTWHLRVEDAGKGGPPVVDYGAIGPDGKDPILQISVAGTDLFPAPGISFQTILGQGGLTIPANPLLQGSIGAPPKAIAGKTNAFRADVIDLQALTVPQAGPFVLAALGYGHMEAQAQAPAGGISCTIPTSKVFTDANGNPVKSLGSGNNFTWKITFPTVDISKELACDLTSVTVTDVAKEVSGSATLTITGADHGGQVTGATVKPNVDGGVTWNLGTYHRGDPPIVLTITGTIPGTSPAGVITNTATVTAKLGNCNGGALGSAFVTDATVGGKAATIQGTAFTGVGAATTSLSGPAVKAGLLAETGQKDPWVPVLGGAFLLGALGLMRGRRRLHAVRSES